MHLLGPDALSCSTDACLIRIAADSTAEKPDSHPIRDYRRQGTLSSTRQSMTAYPQTRLFFPPASPSALVLRSSARISAAIIHLSPVRDGFNSQFGADRAMRREQNVSLSPSAIQYGARLDPIYRYPTRRLAGK